MQARCYPLKASSAWGQRALSRLPLDYLGKQFSRCVGPGKTPGEQGELASPGGTGNILGILTWGGYQTPVLWLGKGAKGFRYNGDIFCLRLGWNQRKQSLAMKSLDPDSRQTKFTSQL